mmetsp:Transcript_7281/g.13814  ORF Transcript_7281/g.13814 Transcript_7281/m.13814 type:complete len:229 (-) Transcript_7281:1260-1946(-)
MQAPVPPGLDHVHPPQRKLREEGEELPRLEGAALLEEGHGSLELEVKNQEIGCFHAHRLDPGHGAAVELHGTLHQSRRFVQLLSAQQLAHLLLQGHGQQTNQPALDGSHHALSCQVVCQVELGGREHLKWQALNQSRAPAVVHLHGAVRHGCQDVRGTLGQTQRTRREWNAAPGGLALHVGDDAESIQHQHRLRAARQRRQVRGALVGVLRERANLGRAGAGEGVGEV